MNHKILIAITTYNRLDFTKRCIESLYKNTNGVFEVVVFDNGSTDGTIEYLTGLEHPFLNVIQSKENIGVAKAINSVLELRKPDQHFMKLDNDIVIDDEVDKDWLKNICLLLDSKVEVVVNGGKFQLGALCLKPDKLLPEFENKVTLGFKINEKQHEYVFEFNPEGVLGCSTIYSRDVFEKIKSFNEEMGLYGYEDSLINIRLFKSGLLSFFETNTKCYHIDPGGDTHYLKWKHEQARLNFDKYLQIYNDYNEDKRDVAT